MIEYEFLTCAEPRVLLDWLLQEPHPAHLRGRAKHYTRPGDRKLRLFVAAVEREWWGPQTGRLEHLSLDVMEAAADGGVAISSREYQDAFFSFGAGSDDAVILAHECVRVHNSRGDAAIWANILRELVGNPFRPLPVCPYCAGGYVPTDRNDDTCETCKGTGHSLPLSVLRWSDGIVPKIAEGIYRRRAWDDMPMLHDVLLDAGCDDESILSHLNNKERCSECKGHGSYTWPEEDGGSPLLVCKTCDGSGWIKLRSKHTRGCWVLDFLTGRS